MWLDPPFHKAIVGHFGSGKTEIAINAARYLARSGVSTCLVDLDIVNPFFRSAEKKDLLISEGIDVIYPQFALSAVDIPVLGADIIRAFENPGVSIFDVGGDDSGAAALGVFKERAESTGTKLYYVINPYRPRSSAIGQITALMEKVSLRARMDICGIIANANLGSLTDPTVLREGREIIQRVSELTGIPVVAECGVDGTFSEGSKWEPFIIERTLKPEWQD